MKFIISKYIAPGTTVTGGVLVSVVCVFFFVTCEDLFEELSTHNTRTPAYVRLIDLTTKYLASLPKADC